VNKFWLGAENHKEDLYFWMAKQQDNKKKHFTEKENARPAPPKLHGHAGQTRSGIMQERGNIERV